MQKNEQERSAIKHLLSSAQWPVIERLAEELCQRLKSDNLVRDTEWETIQATLLAEGEVRGIRRFIKELYGEVSKL